MKKSKKLLSLLLAGVMMVGLLAGCSNSTGFDGKNLTVCIASEPQTIDPALNSAVDGAIMTQHIFEGLMKWADSGKAIEDSTLTSAELVKGQAKDYTKAPNADGTVTYTCTLRDDIKWSDGKAVTAGDFAYAWQRAVDPATAADYSNMFVYIVNAPDIIAGTKDKSELAVKAVDDKTLEVTLYNDTPYFLELCAFPTYLPIRQDMIAAKGDQWTLDPATYIGNGAYKMKEWNHNQKIVMEKNKEYYDYAKLGPETITFTLTDDNNAMLAGYKSNEIQFIEDMPVNEIPSLLSSGDLQILPYIGTYYVCYQNEKAPFDDWRVRKAFTLAIDSKYIVEKVTQTGQIPANGWVASGVADADPTGPDFRTTGGEIWTAPTDDAIYKANLEEANKLLDEAGYTDRTTFPVVEYLYNTSDAHQKVGEALQQQWQTGLGVTVTLKNQEWAAFLETRKNGEYQIARNGWISDYNDPMAFLDMWVTGGGNNDAQYSNADYDAAIKKANATADPAERMAAMHEAETILMNQDWALGPIYFYTQKCMLKDTVGGVYYTPLGYTFFSYATKK